MPETGSIQRPCRNVGQGFQAHPREDGRARVFYFRGGASHEPFPERLESEHSGEEGAPTVFRAWPGTGLPRITSRTLIGFGDAGGRHLVFDGLEITGVRTRRQRTRDGIEYTFGAPGIQWNGGGDGVVRNTVVHGNGRGGVASNGSSAGIRKSNGATNILIEDNLIFDNGGLTDLGEPLAGGAVLDALTDSLVVRWNRIWDNYGYGVFEELGPDGDTHEGAPRFVIEHNVICGNARRGVQVTRTGARVRSNTIAFNQEGAIRGSVLSERNLVVANGPPEAADDPIFSRSDWVHDQPGERDDGPVTFLDPDACILAPSPGDRDVTAGAFVSPPL